ncbi:hypothetical protein NX871_07510 [Burkholderia thailandensis]|uniref:hypothetical protein n=1 Tax=Burkholderia thailandensis TaxID=57975 RepID=UPI001E360FF3|nr:hypothetical protein [Burkholderia thailandensis]MCS6469806.1 hypothetical protein [Burkholderia thailandensis]
MFDDDGHARIRLKCQVLPVHRKTAYMLSIEFTRYSLYFHETVDSLFSGDGLFSGCAGVPRAGDGESICRGARRVPMRESIRQRLRMTNDSFACRGFMHRPCFEAVSAASAASFFRKKLRCSMRFPAATSRIIRSLFTI